MSSSSDSDFDNDEPTEEDLKMQKMLADWDANDDEDAFEDDDDDDDEDADRKKKALLRGDDDDDDDEEEEEEEEEEEYEEEEVEEEYEEDEEVVEEGEEDEVTVDPTVADPDDGKVVDTLKKKPKKKKEKKKLKKLTEIDEGDTEEDKEMKKMLAGWDDGKDDDDDDDKEEEEDDSEQSEREVILDDNVIDHIVLAAPDLEEAMKEFEASAGVGAVIAGTIKGLGIKCARVSFNDSSYLEIIAPDPNGPGPIGELLKSKGIKELTPFHYAIRTSQAEELKSEVKQFGYTPDHITMFGAKPDGSPKKWEMLYLYGHKLGGVVPFFINWDTADHPCRTLPVVGKLKKFTIRAPEGDPVHELLEHVNAEGINIEVGKPKVSFQFSSPEGTVKFSSAKPVGFKFPGFEDANGEGDIEEDYEVEDLEFDNPTAPELLEVGDGNYDDDDVPAY